MKVSTAHRYKGYKQGMMVFVLILRLAPWTALTGNKNKKTSIRCMYYYSNNMVCNIIVWKSYANALNVYK